ncbi:MAG TPA: DUF362 domain-containing protein, partial [Candidatus Sulfotelmatobacter sp.]|nr:DUF362 domain-containing protein [Candidatus Sulfotelmatobacter sp.]
MRSIIRPLLAGNNAWMKKVLPRVRAFWARCCFPLMTAVALIWFLVRVIPKPGRASYPCQRAAFPLASACVIWLLGLKASMVTGVKTGLLLRKVRVALAGITVVFAFSLIAWGIGLKQTTAGLSTDGPNSPMGTGKGLYPGRVAWIHDPTAALWNSAGNWWADTFNNQAAIDQMVSKTIRCVAGQNTDAAAWDCLFHSFNKRTGKGDVGYAPGEKIAIKINENNTSSHADSTEINASPHMVLALLKELINQAGVAQSNITVFDASRFITDNLYNKCHGQFPGVVFVDNIGGGGRVKTTYQTNAILYSVSCNLAKGLATCVVQANYVIDMAVLKGHVGQGITLCGKNFYGSTSIASDWTKNSHDYFSPKSDGSPTYVAFTDFLGHKDLGGKTLLFMIDALYGCKVVNGPPGPKWNLSPFSGRWPSSLFVSEDGVAVDSVALDFFRSEWATAGDLNYCDTYLHEAALANNPPSHTFYDPERDGIRCPSLGVHEHWNNASTKAYSRNLGKNAGIELVALHSVAGVSIAITNP